MAAKDCQTRHDSRRLRAYASRELVQIFGWLSLIVTLTFLCGCRAQQPTFMVPASSLPFPIVSEITDFEYQVIQEAENSTDDETWLKMALIMGGRVRTRERAEVLVERYRTFLRAVAPLVDGQSDPYEKGRVLFLAMHEQLLGNDGSEDVPPNYENEQVRVDVLLEDGHYNCLSASVLYGLAARHFGFEVTAVPQVEHVSLRLRLRDGRTVPVETTVHSGYGYEGTESAPLSELSLEELILRTPSTFPAAIDEDAQLRTMEIAGYFSDDELVRVNRLAAWNEHCRGFYDAGQHDRVSRMFDAIGPTITHLYATFSDELTTRYLTTLDMCIAYSMAEFRPTLVALDLADRSLSVRARGTMPVELIHNHAGVYLEVADFIVSEGQFELAIVVVERAERTFPDKLTLQPLQVHVYTSIARFHFDREDWAATIDALRGCQHIEIEGQWICRQNMETAYLNWAFGFMNAGLRAKARTVLQECVTDIPEAQECRRYLSDL